jgi:hypothetical protein
MRKAPESGVSERTDRKPVQLLLFVVQDLLRK